MAIPTEPTLSTRVRMIQRSTGHSAARMSAYISGTKIEPDEALKAVLQKAQLAAAERQAADMEPGEERDRVLAKGQRPIPDAFDYSPRKWNVETSALIVPTGAPEWARDRQSLWLRAEAKERGINAQVARDFRFNFSYGLTSAQRGNLAREVADRFAAMGMCVDMAVHRYGQSWKASDSKTADQVAKWQRWGLPFLNPTQAAGENGQHVRVSYGKDGEPRTYHLFQPHFQAVMTTRPIREDGQDFEAKTTKREALGKGPDGKYRYRVIGESVARQWNDQSTYEPLRFWIADRQNTLLEEGGSERRIDPRRYEVRRAEALELAKAAMAKGETVEASRQRTRAAQLTRDPMPYFGAALRLKELTGKLRERYSQWVAVRHRNRLQPMIDELWKRDRLDFVLQINNLFDAAQRGLGLVPSRPDPSPALAGDGPDGIGL